MGQAEQLKPKLQHVVLVRWIDSKPVTLASNCNGVHPVMTARHWSNASKEKNWGKDRVRSWTFLVFQYNKFMDGVDHLDQYIAQ